MVHTSGQPESRGMKEAKQKMREAHIQDEKWVNKHQFKVRTFARMKASPKYFAQDVIYLGYPEHLSKSEWLKVRRNHKNTNKKLNEYELGTLLGWSKGD